MPCAPKKVQGRKSGANAARSSRKAAPPHELTSFVGRSEAVAALSALVDTARLVSVVGPPGIGKTRLARRLLEGEPGRGHFCDLRGVDTKEGLAAKLAETFVGRLEAGRDLSTLVDAIGETLAEQDCRLIVLDNFEALVPTGIEPLAHWLSVAPKSRFVITTRRILRLRGEHVFDVPPLSLAAKSNEPSEAEQLFIARAQATETSFDAQADAIPALVHRLEGVPLALELAASQMRYRSPHDLLEELRHGPTLVLEARERDIEPQHRSLRAAIEASWSALDPVQRSALSQLTVFRQGFGLEGANSVVCLDSFPNAPPVGEVVRALRDASLIQITPTPDGSRSLRWDMYEAVREYASAFPTGDAAERHARHFLVLGQSVARKLGTSDEQTARAMLLSELGNLRHAFDVFTEDSASSKSIETTELAVVLFEIYRASKPALAIPFLTTALDRLGNRPGDLRARLYAARGTCYRLVGASSHAEADYHAARARLADHPLLEAEIDIEEGALAFWRGDIEHAQMLFRRGIAGAERFEAGTLECHGRAWLGELLNLGFHDPRALREFDRAIELALGEGDPHLLAHVRTLRACYLVFTTALDTVEEDLLAQISNARQLHNTDIEALAEQILGFYYLDRDQLDASREHLEKALTLSRAHGLRRHAACTECWLARLEERAGGTSSLEDRYERTVLAFRAIGDQRTEAFALIGMSAQAAWQGNIARGEQLLADGAELGAPFGDRLTGVFAELQRARIELARCRRSIADADQPSTRDLLRTARDRVASARQRTATPKGCTQTIVESSVEARWALRMFELELTGVQSRQQVLRVEADGGRFQLGDAKPVTLPNGPVIRRALQVLTRMRLETPGDALGVGDFMTECWPGEKISNEAGSIRVRQVVARLRKAGIVHVIHREKAGYLLDPELPVEWQPAQVFSGRKPPT